MKNMIYLLCLVLITNEAIADTKPQMTSELRTEIRYLSGEDCDHTVNWDFFCTAGRKSGFWSKIRVPSCWEQEGYGAYNYGQDDLKERINEEGHYRFAFHSEREWKHKKIVLAFEGVMTDCEVRINGKTAGPVHQGAFYPFSYDISNLLKFGGNNLLEVRVKKHSDNTSVNEAERTADYWIFGGIFRPVYLKICPIEHIERVAVDARDDGTFSSNIYISGLKRTSYISADIIDSSGEQVDDFQTSVQNKKQSMITISGNLQSPSLWSPEFPNLYTVCFRLLDRDRKILHETSEKIGFRTVKIRAMDGIYVNGVRIKFKGINRHTFHPDYARTSSKRLSVEAVRLIREMNMNAVRMSHYPPDRHFLDVCDSLGLFVLDELAGWQKPGYDAVVGRKLLGEMISRDVNHPCIVLWDNGNEGGWNTIYDKDFSMLDIQKREVLHPWSAFEKMNTAHYVDYNYLSLYNFDQRSIYFSTELLHGLYDGGLGAGLDDYWLKMWNAPLCAGGFLWVFADEAVHRTDTGEMDSDGNHAPDGILGPYLEKEGSFFTVKEIWAPVFIEDKFITPEFTGTFNIENRYHFTDLSMCSFTYQWVRLPSPDRRERLIIEEGSPEVQDLKPGQRGVLCVNKPEGWQKAHVLLIEAKDPYDMTINRWSLPVQSPAAVSDDLVKYQSAGDVSAEESSKNLTLRSNDIIIEISKSDGTLQKVINKQGVIPLSGGPLMVSKSAVCKNIECYQKGNQYIIEAFFDPDDLYLKWTMHPGGLLDLNVVYKPEKICEFAGITFDFPEESVSSVKWLGNGPYRVWKNRMKGVEFDVWEKRYNNTITGYKGYEYPEFKGYYSNFYWAEIRGRKIPGFRVYCHSEDIFLRMLTPEDGPDPRYTSVLHPSGNISFLHGIPAIGTKFRSTKELGPQSSPYAFDTKRVKEGSLSLWLTLDFSVSPIDEDR